MRYELNVQVNIFFKGLIYTLLPSTFRSSVWSLSLKFPHQYFHISFIRGKTGFNRVVVKLGLEGKGGLCVGLTSLLPPCADCDSTPHQRGLISPYAHFTDVGVS